MCLPGDRSWPSQIGGDRPGKGKSVVLVFLTGAPSHQDIWDLKPEASDTVRGEFKPIDTNVPGMQVGPHIPKLARLADKYSIVRSMTHSLPGHEQGTHFCSMGLTSCPPRCHTHGESPLLAVLLCRFAVPLAAPRRAAAAPLLTDLKSRFEEQELLPKSDIGKAASYTQNQWDALIRYLIDGDLSIDNNAAERAMKPVAIGRKNWLFAGCEQAGDRAAILMSLIASCKSCEVEPWAWLNDVLTKLPQVASLRQDTSLESLLPDVWLTKNPQHRWTIAKRRRKERHRKGDL